MRYIDIQIVLSRIPPKAVKALRKRHQRIVNGNDQVKSTIIGGGSTTWTKVKSTLEKFSKRKCWYTESKNPGCTNDVDHFRPKGKKEDGAGNIQYWYWFLAFDPENYRLSCQLANRPNFNPVLNGTGGKHYNFPLLNSQIHSTTKTDIALEHPILLDPCNEDDCNLLQFLPDGRPVIAHSHADDQTAKLRVDKSNLLLNLDYPTFNEDREQLYNKIRKLVARGDQYHNIGNTALSDVIADLLELMEMNAEYSKAAESYVRCFRDRPWVESIFVTP